MARETSERFDKQSWKAMQQTMNETTKFVDMLHNVPWEDGLPADVIHGNYPDIFILENHRK